jgi:hypothetical protein
MGTVDGPTQDLLLLSKKKRNVLKGMKPDNVTYSSANNNNAGHVSCHWSTRVITSYSLLSKIVVILTSRQVKHF